ncbi:esterase-like activity of phytase family protein [Saccharothrix sp. NRRL B-16348]|jgi:3-phytase|uniref:esterase-like activity of phytase family protein n=1 Tax=Saccharothrix sp. NRRL B-16348 TaxID=1415542 RepID=UPI0006AFD7FD|nr:esterase-like activity of phytase family protein [Saccharothrix sp. NRRL B-16348]
MRLRSCLIALGFAATAVVSTVPAASAAPHVRFLGETTLPHGLQFQGTAVGGLSGVDRDPRTGEYVLISDDRGYTNPPRFYTAELEVDASGVHDVRLTGTHALRHPDGGAYSSPALNDGRAVDPEEIRIDPLTGDYWWSQEGDRPTAAGAPVIQPSVQRARRDGAYAADLPLPANYAITPDRGPRRNLALEAITFSAGGLLVTSVVEGPLVQDGDVPTATEGANTRLTVQGRDGTVLRQHAYPLEPLFAAPEPGPWGPDTGVPAILADPKVPGRYYALERSWVPGADYKVRLFQVDIAGATDVRDQDVLADDVRPVRKKQLADLDDFPLPVIDNVEGLTWGPRLPTGERTLLLVSDDNFAAEEFTRFIALALR